MRQVDVFPQRVASNAGLGVPLLEELRDGEPDVFGDLAQERWRDVAARVERDSCRTPGTVAKLPVRPALCISTKPGLRKMAIASAGCRTGMVPTLYALSSQFRSDPESQDVEPPPVHLAIDSTNK